jgi:hypothetical protein
MEGWQRERADRHIARKDQNTPASKKKHISAKATAADQAGTNNALGVQGLREPLAITATRKTDLNTSATSDNKYVLLQCGDNPPLDVEIIDGRKPCA